MVLNYYLGNSLHPKILAQSWTSSIFPKLMGTRSLLWSYQALIQSKLKSILNFKEQDRSPERRILRRAYSFKNGILAATPKISVTLIHRAMYADISTGKGCQGGVGVADAAHWLTPDFEASRSQNAHAAMRRAWFPFKAHSAGWHQWSYVTARTGRAELPGNGHIPCPWRVGVKMPGTGTPGPDENSLESEPLSQAYGTVTQGANGDPSPSLLAVSHNYLQHGPAGTRKGQVIRTWAR
jgi:hypothetical protein